MIMKEQTLCRFTFKKHCMFSHLTAEIMDMPYLLQVRNSTGEMALVSFFILLFRDCLNEMKSKSKFLGA